MPSLWPLGPGSAAGRDGRGPLGPPCQRGTRLGSWAQAPGLGFGGGDLWWVVGRQPRFWNVCSAWWASSLASGSCWDCRGTEGKRLQG